MAHQNNNNESHFCWYLLKDFNLIINHSVIINWTRDPFDRLIVSNASVDNHILLTKDYHILNHYENAVWD